MAGLPAHSGEQERPRPAFSYPTCGLGAHLIQAGQQIESSSDPEDQGTQQEINRQNAHTPRLGSRGEKPYSSNRVGSKNRKLQQAHPDTGQTRTGCNVSFFLPLCLSLAKGGLSQNNL